MFCSRAVGVIEASFLVFLAGFLAIFFGLIFFASFLYIFKYLASFFFGFFLALVRASEMESSVIRASF